MPAPTIVVIGAGSASFGLHTIGGVLQEGPTLRGATLRLVDVDDAKLQTMSSFACRASAEFDGGLTVEATTDRRAALSEADFVIISVEVDRYPTEEKDWEIPLAHGIKHVFGQNGGPGGLSHSLRTIPLALSICRDIEELAPDALVLNYTNPLTRVCLALTRYTNLRIVGLCHGIAHAYRKVGHVMGWVTVPRGSNDERAQLRSVAERIDVQACGLNHFTFITDLWDRETGRDLYPTFRERLATSDPGFQPISRCLHDAFGLYPAQEDDHVGEYVAWGADTYPNVRDFPELQRHAASLRERVEAAARGDTPTGDLLDSEEVAEDRAPAIIAAMVSGRTQCELAVNVTNGGCIGGLPDSAVVEVPGVVGPYGVRGVCMGALPPGITALLADQIAIQERVVEAAIHGDRAAALQAMLLDPVSNQRYTGATALLNELLSAQSPYLPQFA